MKREQDEYKRKKQLRRFFSADLSVLLEQYGISKNCQEWLAKHYYHLWKDKGYQYIEVVIYFERIQSFLAQQPPGYEFSLLKRKTRANYKVVEIRKAID